MVPLTFEESHSKTQTLLSHLSCKEEEAGSLPLCHCFSVSQIQPSELGNPPKATVPQATQVEEWTWSSCVIICN